MVYRNLEPLAPRTSPPAAAHYCRPGEFYGADGDLFSRDITPTHFRPFSHFELFQLEDLRCRHCLRTATASSAPAQLLLRVILISHKQRAASRPSAFFLKMDGEQARVPSAAALLTAFFHATRPFASRAARRYRDCPPPAAGHRHHRPAVYHDREEVPR